MTTEGLGAGVDVSREENVDRVWADLLAEEENALRGQGRLPVHFLLRSAAWDEGRRPSSFIFTEPARAPYA